jgi:calcineurin-like phosphoesterase family protein
MNEALIQNYCSIVKSSDQVYFLGDFAMWGHQHIIKQLPGQKYLILGNHDYKFRKKFRDWGFIWVKDVFELKVPQEGKPYPHPIWLSHYSHQIWPKKHYGAWHLFAHSHGNCPGIGLSTDVGVDCWNYKPVSLATLQDYFKLKQEEIDSKLTGDTNNGICNDTNHC